VEEREFEAWARVVVERAAGVVFAAIPVEQQPREGKTVRAVRGRVYFISRTVHFRHPAMPADRAVWLYAVPAGHAYDFKPPHARVAAGLLQDTGIELAPSRFASGLTGSSAWSWKTHIDERFEGWRMAIKVDPDADAAEDRGEALAAQVLRGLRSAELVP
jgi:hypothetical protein